MNSTRIILIAVIVILTASGSFAQQIMNVQGDPIPGVPGYGVELGLDASGNVAALLVYKGTTMYQELVACTPQAVPRGTDVGSIASADLNFDGYGDLLLQVTAQDKNATFCVWLFDPGSRKYVASDALNQLVNPRADPKTKMVTAYKNMGCGGSCYDKQTYKWINGALTLTRDESVTRNMYAPTGDAGGCSFLRSIKELKNGQLVEMQRDNVNDMGALCGAIQ